MMWTVGTGGPSCVVNRIILMYKVNIQQWDQTSFMGMHTDSKVYLLRAEITVNEK